MNAKTITAKTDKMQKRIDEFEASLRELCYEAMALKEDLAEAEPDNNTAEVDGEPVYTGNAKRFAHMEHYLDKFIVDYFGCYNAPDGF